MKTDNSFGSAKNLGSIKKKKIAKGTVDKSDNIDYFQLNLKDSSSFSIESKKNLKSNLLVELFNSERKRVGKFTFKKGKNSDSLDRELDEGKYFVRVKRKGNGSKYKLKLSASKSDNRLDLANDLGVLSNTITRSNSVGGKDTVDYYTFTLNKNSDLEVDFNSRSAGINVELIFDENNNQRVNSGEVLDSDASSSFNANGSFSEPLPFGTYYLKVEPSSRFSDTSTNYDFSLVATNQSGTVEPELGNALSTANDLGQFPGTKTVEDYVGIVDSVDYYKLTLNQNGNIEATVTTESLLGLDVDLIIDSNGNGLVDGDEVFDGVDLNGLSRSFTEPLPKGTYFIQVAPRSTGASTQYKLDVVVTDEAGNVSPEAGNTIPTASDLGVLSTTRNLKDYVGIVDLFDFYKFTLDQNSDVEVTFTTESQLGLDVDLILDQNNNGLVDDQEIIDGVDLNGLTRNFVEALPTGTYFIKVAPRSLTGSGFSTQYELNVVPTAAPSNVSPEPGNTISTATALGTLSTSTVKDYVGALDTADFYQFTLSQPSELEVTFTTQSEIGLDVDLIADTNNNGLVDSGEIIGGVDFNGLTRNFDETLAPGTYLVQVSPRSLTRSGFSTLYDLSLVATV